MEQTEPIQPASCNTCGKVPPEELIGRAGEPIRCLAMGAGGFDSAMQLGVAHAMVVSDSKPPDVVVGISMGAVNGTALAEILDGESDAMAAPSRRELQLSRFRTFLYAAQDLNETLAAATAPDMYEADAGHVLEPHHLAIHFKNERTARQQALRARSGMVLLINTLVTLRISIGTLVRFIRCVLGLRASGELPPLKRAGVRIRELFRILHTVLFNLRSCGELLYAVFWGAIRASVMRLDTDYYPDRGSTAGEIIFRFRVFRKIARLLRWTVAIVLFAAFLWVLVRHWIATPVVVVALVILLHIVLKQGRPSRYMRLLRWLRDANLARYDLLRDLASPYVIEEILVRLFDKDYYGHVRMEEVVEAAFGHNAVQDPGRDSGYGHQPRSFKRYRERSGIHVVPMVGDLGKGELSSVDPDTPVVKGLLAATAIVPWLRPVELGNSLFIDGANVSNEPVAALVGHLRSHIHPEVTAAFVYPVSHLPIEQEHIPTSRGEMYSGLVDVVTRAQQLQAFRHARLERKLIRLYARVLGETRQPPETIKSGVGQPRALHCFGPVGTRDRHFIRADLFPIEPETKPITVARHLLRTTTKDEKQRVIAAAVADGCRLTLERIIPEAVRGDGTTTEVRCAQVLARRRGEKIEGFPGASEVCSQCALNRKSEDPDQVSPQTLRILQKYHAPEWPRRDSPKETAWHPQTAPRKERQEPADHKPQVGLLFSGGVFRGVFLVGVLNALNELRIKPTIIAGSSVGSITAAMAARIFSEDGDNSEYQRRSEIVRLAATFLALDHLIVTDRFADFVRRLTLRAAETNFSLRDLDRILRRYDIDPPEQFSDTARAVVAGIEHLLYISPWELEQLIRTMRLREYRKTILLLRSYCQELLDRGNVGLEVLGTEPLSLLIQQHVITEWMALHPSRITADVFRKRGLHFLATMTNLTSGELEVVGMPPKKGQAPRSAAKLVETLLASSAFPGVFRPRWGWEIFEGSMARAQFIDGGVMDNLPLNPIVDFLVRSEGIPRRTTMGVPHLLFTASLESDIRPIGGDDLRDIAARWPEAQKRAKQMQYNKKVDGFANVQADMRAIYDAYIAQESDITQLIPIDPLSLAVVVVKPKWLCDTFAFHPMLGFKRSKQAASIAHGCASTFQRFVKLQDEDKAARIWLGDQGWDLRVDLLRDLTESGALKGDTIEPKARADGRCHFTSKIVCPFAAATGIESVDAQRTAMLLGFGDKTAERPLTTAALREIYDACGKRATHQPQA